MDRGMPRTVKGSPLWLGCVLVPRVRLIGRFGPLYIILRACDVFDFSSMASTLNVSALSFSIFTWTTEEDDGMVAGKGKKIHTHKDEKLREDQMSVIQNHTLDWHLLLFSFPFFLSIP